MTMKRIQAYSVYGTFSHQKELSEFIVIIRKLDQELVGTPLLPPPTDIFKDVHHKSNILRRPLLQL